MNKKYIKNSNRRKLLKSAAITGGVVSASGLMADKWAKPIVSAVVLPAHAQTTGAQRFLFDENFIVMNESQSNGRMIAQKAKDMLISSANAQANIHQIIYLELIEADMYKFVYFSENDDLFEYATANLTIEMQQLVDFDVCDNGDTEEFSANVLLESVSSGEAKLTITFDGDTTFTARFNAGAVEPVNPACVDMGA